jgi:hypothetical protein
MDVQIGLQLYSVRKSLAKDPWRTLADIARAGFSRLFAGVVSPTETIDLAVFEERKDTRCFTEISTGVLPIQDIIDAASKLPNLEYMFLEQDHTTLPEIDSIRHSHDAFSSRFTGITWP